MTKYKNCNIKYNWNRMKLLRVLIKNKNIRNYATHCKNKLQR